MRIISGIYKGKRLNPPTNITARPTTDFAKESLFNVLNNRIDFEEISALDMFAGTGGISFELASRGCPSITAVEKGRVQLNFIRKTIKELNLDAVHLIAGDTFKFISSYGAKFDFIFADPPYDLPELEQIPDLVFQYDLLSPDGLFILEHPSRKQFTKHSHFKEHRNYGNVNFSFFQ